MIISMTKEMKEAKMSDDKHDLQVPSVSLLVDQ
jgi:hypothetical protein